jgi:hypothetical protein
MGYIAQFGNYSVYHSGDTLLFEGQEEILKPYKVDIALLPINGNRPERKVAGNLNITTIYLNLIRKNRKFLKGNAISTRLIIKCLKWEKVWFIHKMIYLF